MTIGKARQDQLQDRAPNPDTNSNFQDPPIIQFPVSYYGIYSQPPSNRNVCSKFSRGVFRENSRGILTEAKFDASVARIRSGGSGAASKRILGIVHVPARPKLFLRFPLPRDRLYAPSPPSSRYRGDDFSRGVDRFHSGISHQAPALLAASLFVMSSALCDSAAAASFCSA